MGKIDMVAHDIAMRFLFKNTIKFRKIFLDLYIIILKDFSLHR